MGSEPRTASDDAIEHTATYVTFTSQAYAATTDDETTRAAAKWLEAILRATRELDAGLPA